MEFKERLRFVRESKNITQEKLAKELNTTQQFYSRYETGVHTMPVTNLEKICKFANVSSEYILGFTEKIKEFESKTYDSNYYNKNMKIAREYRGYTQTEVAKNIGIKVQQYTRYEKGNTELPVPYLIKYCEFLNISPDYILGLINEVKPLDKNKRN